MVINAAGAWVCVLRALGKQNSANSSIPEQNSYKLKRFPLEPSTYMWHLKAALYVGPYACQLIKAVFF